VKLPRLDTSTQYAPEVERMVADLRSRRPTPLSRRERLAEIPLDIVLVGAVVAIAAGFEWNRSFDLGPALCLTLVYALASRARFELGAGWGDCSQLVLVPMLFEIPAPLVPVFVAAGLFLSTLIDVVRGRVHPDRLLIFAGNLYAVGPALVFAIAHVENPSWSDAAIYLGAFGAQIASDLLPTTLREWMVNGVAPRIHLSVLERVYMVDTLLTPIGLLAAFAAGDEPYRVLLILPLIALLAVFAQEREARMTSVLELSTAYRGTALLLGDVLEDKDAYTASHSHGVVDMSLRVCDALGLDPAARRRVEFGALLHDIGKLAVPVEIINKPGPLDDGEWAVMKLHTVEGQQMLDRVGGILGEVGRVVRASHEHWDGSGYPDGLAGEQIPIESRIISACDAMSAMTTNRSYRRAMTRGAAKVELRDHAGTQFDPQVVDVLLGLLEDDEREALGRRPSRALGDG
jgi:HD-GYP domain-containing protein (c-di-GMP phosphodiesterase class II)